MDAQLEKLLQDQIRNEWYSAYLYLSMAVWAEMMNLEGFANWMKKQAGEEQVHGQKMFDFLIDRGVKVVLQGIPSRLRISRRRWTSSRSRWNMRRR